MRKSTRAQAVRASQRKWLELVEAWRAPEAASGSWGEARDALVEQLAHEAQTLCRTVKDRAWLVSAFQMAIHAVLLTHPDAAPSSRAQDAAETARREQLGLQLLQLATHSIAKPWLTSLERYDSDTKAVAMAQEVVDQFEEMRRRLAVFQHLRTLAEQSRQPVLPLSLVLQQPTLNVLLCLASIPQGVRMIEPLLKECPWLVAESAHARLPIVRQVLSTTPSTQESYAHLATHGLLITWKDGAEASAWCAQPSSVSPLPLDEWTHFYRSIVVQPSRARSDAATLLNALASTCQGSDVQDAISRLHSLLATTPATALQDSQQQHVAEGGSGGRFDLDAVRALAAQVSSTARDDAAQHAGARELVAAHDVRTLSQRLTQLIDTNDSVDARVLALRTIAHASSTPRDSAVDLVRLCVAVLYARPAVGDLRFDLRAPARLVAAAESGLSALSKLAQLGPRQPGVDGVAGRATKLSRTLRTALAGEAGSVVPACQVLALLSADEEVEQLHEGAQMHVRWLRTLAQLLDTVDAKPRQLDLAWLAAFGGAHHDGAANDRVAYSQQLAALGWVIDAFSAATPPPSSLGGRADRAGADAALLRFRAAWDGFLHDCLALCSSASAPLALVGQSEARRLLLGQMLRTGDVDLFRSLTTDDATLAAEELEALVLEVSCALFDQASVASTRTKDIRLALGILDALPSGSVRATTQREFIEAACRLSAFKLRSLRRPGEALEPSEIRQTRDRMELVARLLGSHEDAHRSPELVLDLAQRLCGLEPLSPADKTLVEVRTLAMLADAATAAEDFEAAASFCQRLVERVSSVRFKASSAGGMGVELGWKTCLQVSKHPGWEDTPARIAMLAQAMALCPPQQLAGMLRQWHALDQQLVRELEQGRQFASTKKAAAGGAGWRAPGVGELFTAHTAATAASVGAGLVGSAANLLPLSFSPLSYFGSANGAQTQPTKPEGERVDARTARLFDFDAVSGASSGSGMATGSGYVDPAERAVRAARAARDFLGWKSEVRHADGATEASSSSDSISGAGAASGGSGAGGFGGFSLSRGVGWLIGEADRSARR